MTTSKMFKLNFDTDEDDDDSFVLTNKTDPTKTSIGTFQSFRFLKYSLTRNISIDLGSLKENLEKSRMDDEDESQASYFGSIKNTKFKKIFDSESDDEFESPKENNLDYSKSKFISFRIHMQYFSSKCNALKLLPHLNHPI